MESTVIEASFPLTFHKQEAKELGEHLKNRHNVVLLGMKRVGISNFLRFFLNHKEVSSTYIHDGKNHLFIPVDLNDLVERELVPFWTLTLKRIADAVERSDLPPKVKKEIESLFLGSIQTQDLFLTIDNVRKSLLILVDNGILPTVFFVLFDRLKDAATPEFFANLQGVIDATNHKATFVFTSYRPLDVVAPHVFPKNALVVFSHDMFVRPVQVEDAKIIADTYKERYNLQVPDEVERTLFQLVDGYVRYLHLALVILNEKKDHLSQTQAELTVLLQKDERVYLQSEELWESLTPMEQDVILKIYRKKPITSADEEAGKYLLETGFISKPDSSFLIFSPLFEHFLKSKDKAVADSQSVEFTKKEHQLFNHLKDHVNEICERESIIASVWPEVEALGVSDWAIDRLAARVRNKLKLQKSNFEIQTIKTRGYKLIST